MPQCQRSPNATRLDALPQTEPGVWTCAGPHYGAVGCAGGETYELLDGADLDAALAVVAANEREFGRASPHGEPLVFFGELPQHIVWRGRSELYLSRGTRGNDTFYWQLAHEAFHHVCTPPGLTHWTHEALGMLWSFKHLLGAGRPECALASMRGALATRDDCPLDTLLPFAGGPHPTGLHGRAAYVGLLLEGAAGWERLKDLAGSYDHAGRPNVEGWRATLPADAGDSVAAVLRDTPP